jgi:hypothetical protein
MEGFFMSEEPEDTTQQPNSGAAAPNVSQPEKQSEPGASNETVREIFMRLASGNPRFKEVKLSGKGFIIIGARPQQSNIGGENNGSSENR